jgi:hypothetical protein
MLIRMLDHVYTRQMKSCGVASSLMCSRHTSLLAPCNFPTVLCIQTKTIKPLISKCVQKNSTIYTDEYDIYNYLEQDGIVA